MTRLDLHGLGLAVHCEGLLADQIELALPPVLTELPASGAGVADIEVHVRSLTVDPAIVALINSMPGAFFHGKTNAHWSDGTLGKKGDVILTDGVSWIRVSTDGRLIEATVDARSLADGYSFAHTTFFIAVMVALRSHGLFHLHAALVRWQSRGVMVVGEGGAGKTTSTLALMQAGADWLGDDAVLLCRRRGAPIALRIPKPFHVGEATIAAFPRIGPGLGPAYQENNDKRAFDPAAVFDGRALESAAAPSVVLFPEITGAPSTTLTPLTGAETMGMLAVSSAMMMIDGLARVAEQLSILRDLVDDATGYRLALGTDVLEDPSVIGALLGQ